MAQQRKPLSKKKLAPAKAIKIGYVDYKDTAMLRKFISERGKIRARRVTGNDSQQQKEIARAIKNAREMALLPYANRVTQQRGGRDRGGERGIRADGPPPRPSGPPPTGGAEGEELENFEEFEGADEGAAVEEVEA